MLAIVLAKWCVAFPAPRRPNAPMSIVAHFFGTTFVQLKCTITLLQTAESGLPSIAVHVEVSVPCSTRSMQFTGIESCAWRALFTGRLVAQPSADNRRIANEKN
jgi:hypothetical protein